MVKEGWPSVVRPGKKTAPVITTLGRPFTTIPVCHNKALSFDITQSCIGFFGRTELLAWRSRFHLCVTDQLPLSGTRRDQLPPGVTRCDHSKVLLRGAPPCRHNRHHRSQDSHSSASSHCGGAVAEVFGRTPAVGEAVVGVVAAANAEKFAFYPPNIPPMFRKIIIINTLYSVEMSVKQ